MGIVAAVVAGHDISYATVQLGHAVAMVLARELISACYNVLMLALQMVVPLLRQELALCVNV